MRSFNILIFALSGLLSPHSSAGAAQVEFVWIASPAEQARSEAWSKSSEIAISDFLSFWRLRGLELPSQRTVIFIAPKDDVATDEYMMKRFGGTWRTKLQQHRDALSLAGTPDQAYQASTLLDLEFSPLFAPDWRQLEKWKKLTPREFGKQVNRMIKKIDLYLNSSTGPMSWPQKSIAYGFFDYRGPSADNWLILNRSPRPDIAYDGFDYPEVVFHELGHALHYSLWQTSSDAFPVDQGLTDTTVNELIADLFSHIYLQTDGCHRRKKAGAPPEALECNRRIDQNDSPFSNLFDELVHGVDGHDGADNVRAFLWKLYQEIGRDDFADRLVPAVSKVRSELIRQHERFKDPSWWKDAFLSTYRAIAYPYAVIARFSEAICKSPAPRICLEKDIALGKFDQALLSDLIAHAPATAMKSGKIWTVLHPQDRRALTLEFGKNEFTPGAEETALWVTDRGIRAPFRIEGEMSTDPAQGFIELQSRSANYRFRYNVKGTFDIIL
jgi:hypothetical protein